MKKKLIKQQRKVATKNLKIKRQQEFLNSLKSVEDLVNCYRCGTIIPRTSSFLYRNTTGHIRNLCRSCMIHVSS